MRKFWSKWLVMTLGIYVPGLIIYLIIPEAFEKEFRNSENIFMIFFPSVFFFIACSTLLFSSFLKIEINKHYFTKPIVQRTILVVFLFSIVLGFNFFLKYNDSSFRHNHRFSESGFSSMIVFLLRSLMEVFLLFLMCNLDENKKLLKTTKLLVLLSALFLILTLNSSLQVIILIIPLIILFKPAFLNKMLTFKSFFQLLIPIIVIVLGVLIYGIGNKIGYDVLFSDGNYLKNYGKDLGTRVSTSLFSIAGVASNNFIEQGFEGITSQLYTASNRINLLLGLEFNAQAIETVDRMNYLNLFRDYNARAGSTPYLLASMWYMPIGLGFLFIPFLFSVYSRIIYQHLKKLSNIGYVRLSLIYLCSVNFFEAPLNFFLVIDAVPFRFVCIILFFFFVKPDYFLKSKII